MTMSEKLKEIDRIKKDMENLAVKIYEQVKAKYVYTGDKQLIKKLEIAQEILSL